MSDGGGGSVEDLWCFNDEAVVRAIFASEIPVVSAVGHEIDVTLSDLVADLRALTPSEAAELVVPSSDELQSLLAAYRQRLVALLRSRAQSARVRLDGFANSRVLRHPADRLRELARRVDELELRANRAILTNRSKARDGIAHMAERLESLSPLAVLSRGYSVTHRSSDGRLVTDASTVSAGEQIRTRLARGSLTSRIEAIEKDS